MTPLIKLCFASFSFFLIAVVCASIREWAEAKEEYLGTNLTEVVWYTSNGITFIAALLTVFFWLWFCLWVLLDTLHGTFMWINS